MKFSSFLLSLSLLIVMSSCEDTNTEVNTNPSAEGTTTESVVANEMDQLMLTIDEGLESRPVVKSLRYSKEDMSSIEVTAYLDDSNSIQKMIETSLYGPTGQITRKHFYSNEGALFASRVIEDMRPENGEAFFQETISFYDIDGNVISSKQRKADFEEQLEQEEFFAIDKVGHSMANTMMVLNQEGPYETTFQGFVNSGPYSFLIVGADTTDGYTSALSIQAQDATINWLHNQDKNALGRKLVVKFERILDPQGYEIQILEDLALTEKP